MSTMTATRPVHAARPARPVRPTLPAPRRVERPASSAQGQGQVRLTRRGRLVVFLACLFLVLAAALFLGATSVATGEQGVDQPTQMMVVGEGDTLWAIAAELAEDGEVREMMHTIKRLNALDSSMLVAGQELHVPVG